MSASFHRFFRPRQLGGKQNYNPGRVLALSFLVIILLGTGLLMLPAASRDGSWTPPLTALFTATSATCVTGLSLVDTGTYWSFFGQVIILIMIQLGGLGFITLITALSFLLHRRVPLSRQMTLMSALNLKSMAGLSHLTRHAFLGTALFEGVGAVLLALRFVPRYGPVGVWYGIFHSISAFCNAGFDLIGGMEHCAFDVPINLTLIVLIVFGGLGFFVWEDVLSARGKWRRLTLYSRIALGGTAALIVLVFLAVLGLEWRNPATLGALPLPQKLLAALFQSVTLRTAGFSTIAQGAFTESCRAMNILVMLVGGCSGSTAGGIKVGTLVVLLVSLRAGLTGRDQVTLGAHTLHSRQAFNALTLCMLVLGAMLGGAVFVSVADGLSIGATAFECASALATVGLSTGITAQLSSASRILVAILMYLGRVGILSFSLAVMTSRPVNEKIRYPYADVMIG